MRTANEMIKNVNLIVLDGTTHLVQIKRLSLIFI